MLSYPTKYHLFFFITLLIHFSSCSPDNDPIIVVEEELYINEIYASGEDWIELYNNLEVSIDIGAYYIYDNADAKYTLPVGTIVPAKGFVILTCNDLGSGLNTNFKLTSAGETVYLENAAGTLIDRVTFPALEEGQSYGRYPDGSGTLAISGNTTEGVSNGNTQAPAITAVVRAPLIPGLNQEVGINVSLASNANIASVKLFHRFNGGTYSSLTMSLLGGNYVASIPGKATAGLVEYYVEAKGTNQLTSYQPTNAPVDVHRYLLNIDPLPQLVINEFMAFNSSCCPDDDSGVDEFDDWIEIYNKGTVAVNIGEMYLSDNLLNPFKHKIPSDNPSVTTLQPGGHLVLWADNSPSQGPLHLDFALNNTGEAIGLYYIDGRTINEYTFAAQSENISWGRTTDGATTWKSFSTPSPGASN